MSTTTLLLLGYIISFENIIVRKYLFGNNLRRKCKKKVSRLWSILCHPLWLNRFKNNIRLLLQSKQVLTCIREFVMEFTQHIINLIFLLWNRESYLKSRYVQFRGSIKHCICSFINHQAIMNALKSVWNGQAWQVMRKVFSFHRCYKSN